MPASQAYSRLIQAILGLAVFLAFSGYVFLNARLKDTSGDMVFLVLLFLALPRLAGRDFDRYTSFFLALFWSFLAMTLASVLFPSSAYGKLYWLFFALYRLLFSSIIVYALCNLSNLDRVLLRWGLASLCLLLAIGYIGEQQGLAVQEMLKGFTPLPLDTSPWHDKNYAFWQLLLMWGSVALLWRRNLLCTLAAVVVILVSLAAIFLSSSESSQLAAAVSIGVFLFAQAVPAGNHYRIYALLVMTFVLVPVLWVCLAPVEEIIGPFLPKIEAITARMAIFDYTADLIRKELVLGYGFASTIFMRIPEGTLRWPFFPGGHTHNLVLQLFMDHGLLGLVFLSAVLALLFHYLHRVLADSLQAPAVWALLFAGLVLFSLSYAAWNADIVLMYCMWLSLIFAVSTRAERPVATWLVAPGAARFFFVFGIVAAASYGVDYLFLAGK
ncbi:MAG: O-antigen ligase domain-containing protein [Desulforudis sp.]|nr:MAG: O-antigen ligase domain-containing protein [Desulforudis sp.]